LIGEDALHRLLVDPGVDAVEVAVVKPDVVYSGEVGMVTDCCEGGSGFFERLALDWRRVTRVARDEAAVDTEDEIPDAIHGAPILPADEFLDAIPVTDYDADAEWLVGRGSKVWRAVSNHWGSPDG
jgi:hypothetical protein